MKVTNPADGTELGHVGSADEAAVKAAYAAARFAQPAWAGRSIGERIEVVGRFRDLVVQHHDRLAALLTSEVGKPITQSGNELRGVLARLDFFIANAERVLADRVVGDDQTYGLQEIVAHEPLGVVGNVSAWNYPWFIGLNVWVPALLAGNAVLYKPSELAALTGAAVADLWHDAGVPAEVFSALQGDGSVGEAIVREPVDGVFFTGSYRTGRRIAEAVAGRMLHLQLELGGKDPAYVCDDVDVDQAAASLVDGAFYNAGQSCCAVERIYVHAVVYERFVERFVSTVSGLRVGPPSDPATYIGPLTRPSQLGVLADQVNDALAKGATLRTGGHPLPGPGNWFEPTVLTDVDQSMTVMRDETFGPVIGIQRVVDDDQALASVRDTPYGLTAAIYTADEARARAFLSRVATGSAYWNCCDRVSPRLPWSGRGWSGAGVTLGDEGIVAFTRLRSWHLRRA